MTGSDVITFRKEMIIWGNDILIFLVDLPNDTVFMTQVHSNILFGNLI